MTGSRCPNIDWSLKGSSGTADSASKHIPPLKHLPLVSGLVRSEDKNTAGRSNDRVNHWRHLARTQRRGKGPAVTNKKPFPDDVAKPAYAVAYSGLRQLEVVSGELGVPRRHYLTEDD